MEIVVTRVASEIEATNKYCNAQNEVDMRGLHELYHQEDLNINRLLTNSIVETYLDLGASIIARVIYKETP